MQIGATSNQRPRHFPGAKIDLFLVGFLAFLFASHFFVLIDRRNALHWCLRRIFGPRRNGFREAVRCPSDRQWPIWARYFSQLGIRKVFMYYI